MALRQAKICMYRFLSERIVTLVLLLGIFVETQAKAFSKYVLIKPVKAAQLKSLFFP